MAVTALIFVFVLLVAVPLLAQSSATLQGHVVDRSGGTVTGAAITLRSLSMDIGEQREAVVDTAEIPLIDRATTVVGHVVTAQTVLEAPLNGRHFTDLGLLVPGSRAST